jgi:hypothetical protein
VLLVFRKKARRCATRWRVNTARARRRFAFSAALHVAEASAGHAGESVGGSSAGPAGVVIPTSAGADDPAAANRLRARASMKPKRAFRISKPLLLPHPGPPRGYATVTQFLHHDQRDEEAALQAAGEAHRRNPGLVGRGSCVAVTGSAVSVTRQRGAVPTTAGSGCGYYFIWEAWARSGVVRAAQTARTYKARDAPSEGSRRWRRRPILVLRSAHLPL